MKLATAISRFQGQRADYYGYLASFLRSSDGKTLIGTIFMRDAERFKDVPRGRLSAEWHARYEDNGADLAKAWSGTLPEVEVAIVHVTQAAGAGALSTMLDDLARVAQLTDEIRTSIVATLLLAAVGAVIALAMVTLFPIFAVHELKLQYGSFISADQWGPKATQLVNFADAMMNYGPYLIALGVAAVWGVGWTLENLIGPLREKLDARLFIYRTFRDLRASLFLSTMAILTQKRGNVVHTLNGSLEMLRDSSRSPWMQWRYQQILNAMQDTGGMTSEAFNTGLLSQEMFYYLRDIQEAKDFSSAFEEARKYVEKKLMVQLMKRLAIYRWGVLISAVVVMVVVVAFNLSVISEMGDTIRNLGT